MNQEEKGKTVNYAEQWNIESLPWKAWGSWFSWGSPVGLGLFFISIGVLIWLLHVAGLVGR